MKKVVLIFFLIIASAFARVDYTEMSTQELIAIMGYVKDANKAQFKKELKSRVPTMSASEKAQYKKNLNKLK